MHADDLSHKLRGLSDGRIRIRPPERFVFVRPFFDRLNEYADDNRPGGSLLLRRDVRRLEQLDRAFASGAAAKTLAAVLELEIRTTEAHEIRHVISPASAPEVVAGPVLELAGDDDFEFAAAVEGELKAFLGQVRDSEAPPCLSLLRIAQAVSGSRERATPHAFAARAFFDAHEPSRVAAQLDKLCAASNSGLRDHLLTVGTQYLAGLFSPARTSPEQSRVPQP